MKLICATCGNEVKPEEGTLSWQQADNRLCNFRITHKSDQNHNCAPENIAYVHLWILTGLSGYVKFMERLAGMWAGGYILEDETGLKKVISDIGVYIWKKTKIEQLKLQPDRPETTDTSI